MQQNCTAAVCNIVEQRLGVVSCSSAAGVWDTSHQQHEPCSKEPITWQHQQGV